MPWKRQMTPITRCSTTFTRVHSLLSELTDQSMIVSSHILILTYLGMAQGAMSDKHRKDKKYKRRYMYGDSKYWTPYEKQWVENIKTEMLKKYQIDLTKTKQFGPRSPDGIWKEGSVPIKDR